MDTHTLETPGGTPPTPEPQDPDLRHETPPPQNRQYVRCRMWLQRARVHESSMECRLAGPRLTLRARDVLSLDGNDAPIASSSRNRCTA